MECSAGARFLYLMLQLIAADQERYGFLSQASQPIPAGKLALKCHLPDPQYLELLTELRSLGVPAVTGQGVYYFPEMVEREAQNAVDRQRMRKVRRAKTHRANVRRTFLEVEDVVVVGKEASTEPTAKTTSGYLAKTDPVSRVIYAYKLFKGFAKDDSGWDQRNWPRCMKTAPKILELAKGDPVIAERYVVAFGQWADKKRMEYRIETLVKCYDDWMAENGR